MQQLDIGQTQVVDLSPISSLSQLQQFSAWKTLVSNLSPISGFSQLQELVIGHTQVSDLSPLSSLNQLQLLFAWGTQISELSPLSGLSQLQRLDVSNTQVNDLAPILPLIKKGIPVSLNYTDEGISVRNCPLTTPPLEVAQQGNEAILNYFQEREAQGSDTLYEAKLLLVGEGGAGKTSLCRRLIDENLPLPEENETTKGIDIQRYEFPIAEGENFRLNVWDFGGQDIYHATHQFFLTKRSLYILLDDTRSSHKTVLDEGFKYWLEVIDLLSEHSPVLIFQNEKGGRSKAIDLPGIKGRFDNVREVYAGNLEKSDAAMGIRQAIELFALQLPHIGESLPKKWLVIREELEALAKQKPYISQQDYFDIYQKYLDFGREKALHLSRYLHDLGAFLHFQEDELLRRTIILQNEWATAAVFKMLDDETVKDKLGRFDAGDCERLWAGSNYADMHPELRALMMKFELCYRLPDTQPAIWLAPQLLPPSKPEALKDWEQSGDLMLRYRYEFLPKGMVSRLMVRQHRFVQQPELSWRSGAFFERAETQLLVEVPYASAEIILRARGPERKELLSVISAELDTLNATFPGLPDKVVKDIPCNCAQCRTKGVPEFYDQKRLLQRKKDGRLKWECPASYQEIDVLQLLDGVQTDTTTFLAKTAEAQPTQTIKIFLSYSHAQQDYFKVFREDFRQYAKLPGIQMEVFDDYAIPPGANWDEHLIGEVDACNVMILLVSQEFMNSNYIREKEFGAALKRLQSGKNILIVPVYFAPCLFEQEEELRRLQFFKPNGADFDKAQKGAEFSYIDLIKFRETDGQPLPNSNRQHYMKAFMKKLEPELRKV